MLGNNLVLHASIISIEMAPYTRQSLYTHTGGRSKSGTAPSRRDNLDSSRRSKVMEKSSFTASSIDGSVTSFRSVKQPKTILRIQLRHGTHGPRVSLATNSFKPSSPGCPDRKTKGKKDAPESRTDRRTWLRRLRPTPHRRAELVECHN